MSWDNKILNDGELSSYLEGGNGHGLARRVKALIAQQKRSWPMLAGGYRSLGQVETREFQVEESRIVAQYNQARIKSTSARVDKESVEARSCFLCPESLPPEEKGIAYGDDLIILCNPFPVLDNHLSIVHRRHIRQGIENSVETLLDLARELGPEFFVLYNGPECGASAPDHLHFQACSRNLLPLYSDLGLEEGAGAEHCPYCEEAAIEGFELFTLDNCGRAVVVYRGNRSDEISLWLYKTLERLPRGSLNPEPLINIVCTYDRGVWTLFLFPRARHRPSCFYAEGDGRLMISPGAIDMAGVIVVPERAHFDRLGAEDVSSIYREVSADVEAINDLVKEMCESPVEGGLPRGWS
jgi:hypothetical protein